MNTLKLQPSLFISGPTASGKTAVSLHLAQYLQTEIINCDSAQVYSGMDIGTDKLDSESRQGIVHHALDVVPPSEEFSVFNWLAEVRTIEEKLRLNGVPPLYVGGSTLYIASYLEGLQPSPPSNPSLRKELDTYDTTTLHSMLSVRNPARAAQLHSHDRLRIIRALEVLATSNTSESRGSEAHPNSLLLVLLRPREELYSRINQRVHTMMERGLLSETQKLVKECSPLAPGLKALGYAHCLKILNNELDEKSAIEQIARDSRRYAKRQMTFWRNEPLKRGWKQLPEQPAPLAPKQKKQHIFNTLKLPLAELLENVQQTLNKPLSRPQIWYIDARYLCIQVSIVCLEHVVKNNILI